MNLNPFKKSKKRESEAVKAQIPNPAKPTVAGFIGATVKGSENALMEFRLNANATLAQYLGGIAADAAYFNAHNLACVPMRLYRKANPNERVMKGASMSEASGDIEEVLDHPVLDLLKNPDKLTTASSWEVARWVDKQAFGACYLLKAKDEETGKVYLQRLYPQYLIPQPDKQGFISGYYYGRDPANRIPYKAEDILVLKMAEHPSDPYRGLGWLELCLREVGIECEALAAEKARWENGGYPSGVLSFEDELDEDQFNEALRKFQQYYSGSTKAGLPIITSRSAYTPLSNANDMNYQQGLNVVEQRILNRAGIPEPLYKMNDANLAASKTAHSAYARYTLKPMLQLDAEQWTQLLLPAFDLDPNVYFFAYDSVVPEDRDTLRNDIIAYVGSGVWTKNEARAELDYEEIEGLDDKEEEPLFFLPPADLIEEEEE